MKCKDVKILFDEFWANALDDSLKKEVDKHFRECTSCKESYMHYSELLSHIKEDRKVEVNPFLYTRIREKLNDEGRVDSRIPTLRRLIWVMSVAAMLLIGVFTGYFVGNTLTSNRLSFDQTNIEDELFKEL